MVVVIISCFYFHPCLPPYFTYFADILQRGINSTRLFSRHSLQQLTGIFAELDMLLSSVLKDWLFHQTCGAKNASETLPREHCPTMNEETVVPEEIRFSLLCTMFEFLVLHYLNVQIWVNPNHIWANVILNCYGYHSGSFTLCNSLNGTLKTLMSHPHWVFF